MAALTAVLADAVLDLTWAMETTAGKGFGHGVWQAQSMHRDSRSRLFFKIVIGLFEDHTFPFASLPVVINPLAEADKHCQRRETAEDHACRFCYAINLLVRR